MAVSQDFLTGALEYAGLTSANAEDAFWNKSINIAARQRAYYRYSANVPVNPGVIFYETMSGARMGDNPLAIFEYLKAHPEYGEYLHVWSIDVNGEIPAQFVGSREVIFVRRNTAAFTYFLACAGRVICNANLPGYFARRIEQLYLNTWHGVPYKALGRDTPHAKFGAPASTSTFMKATHVLSTCEFMTDAMLSAYSMTGTSNAVIAETGYPRVDLTILQDSAKSEKLRDALGISDADHFKKKPVVLYAPTWRDSDGEDVVDSEQLMEVLGKLSELDVHLMYRGHHRMDRIIRDTFVGSEIGRVTIPSHHISSNELMTEVDILITDYSSIFFDFLPTGKPIIHFLYDYEEYKNTRGLNLGLEDLPGKVAFDLEELEKAITECANGLSEVDDVFSLAHSPLQGGDYLAAQLRFASHEDGRASARAVEFFFGDLSDGTPLRRCRDDRPTTVFWAGAVANEETVTSFLQEAVKVAEAGRSQTAIVIEREAAFDRAVLKRIKALGQNIGTLSFVSSEPVLLPSEKSAYDEFINLPGLNISDASALISEKQVLKRIFTREYRRRIGDAQFDEVVVASGLSNYELALAALAKSGQSLYTKSPQRKVAKPATIKPPAPRGLRRLVNLLLPIGSQRRKHVVKLVRKIRR